MKRKATIIDPDNYELQKYGYKKGDIITVEYFRGDKHAIVLDYIVDKMPFIVWIGSVEFVKRKKSK